MTKYKLTLLTSYEQEENNSVLTSFSGRVITTEQKAHVEANANAAKDILLNLKKKSTKNPKPVIVIATASPIDIEM